MLETLPPTHVALVGHCGFDGASLKRLAQSALPNAEVVAVNHQKDLDRVAHRHSLLLINRVLDGRFDAQSSLEMIEQLAAREDAPKMMLISNYPDAQAEAEAAGALPGFGKSDVGRPDVAERLSVLSA
ncbi:MAG: hypothetical protein AAGH99_09555 [Planctomycetota bacterium]